MTSALIDQDRLWWALATDAPATIVSRLPSFPTLDSFDTRILMVRQWLKSARRQAGRVARSIGLRRGGGEAGRERSSVYYDEAFSNDPHFQVPYYKSPYYPTWMVIVDRLRAAQLDSILDVGCGPGQFAALLQASGFKSYLGLDFSEKAVEMARQQSPELAFRVADARDPKQYEGFDCDAVICMEVLEHIDDDFGVIRCFPQGARCLMTVPNFPWRSHVRHFETNEAVIERYSRWFDNFSVTRIKGMRGKTAEFYLMDGIRNGATDSGDESASSGDA